MERLLREEEVGTIEVLHERGMSNRGIARRLGVTEHAVRYRLRRQGEARWTRGEAAVGLGSSMDFVVTQFVRRTPGQPENFSISEGTTAFLSDATMIIAGREKSGARYKGWGMLHLERLIVIPEYTATIVDLTLAGRPPAFAIRDKVGHA